MLQSLETDTKVIPALKLIRKGMGYVQVSCQLIVS